MEHIVSHLFSQYAYSPFLVYGAICLFMVMSAFGLPIPEEIVLISAGFVGHMSLHPDDYPPPDASSQSVNVAALALVAFIAVIGSDFLIYMLGKIFGQRLFRMRWFARIVSESALERIQAWMRKYGYWAVFIFRFTPGVRFPGHLMCGATGLSRWKFLAVDALAAGISIPTQILLVSFYGEIILTYVGHFKRAVFLSLFAAIVVFALIKIFQRRALKSADAD